MEGMRLFMNKIENLKNILLAEDIQNNIRNNEDILFKIIPELKSEKDFEQKSQWHCYDVWNHTIKAISSAPKDFEIRLVLLLHDIGKPFSYQDDGEIRHFRRHATKSKEISKSILENLGYTGEKLNELLFLIGEHATTINVDNINKTNLSLYKKLLVIQFCDGSAYEINHAKKIIGKLEKIKQKLDSKILSDDKEETEYESDIRI